MCGFLLFDSEFKPKQLKESLTIRKDESNVHISKALNVLLPRECISRERSRRHWVGKSLIQAWNEVDESHDVIKFGYIAYFLYTLRTIK